MVKVRIDKSRFEPSSDAELEGRLLREAQRLLAERLTRTSARLAQGANNRIPQIALQLGASAEAIRADSAAERAAAAALAESLWNSILPLLDLDAERVLELLRLADKAFYDAIKDWDGPTFSRLLYDGTTKKIRDQGLHTKFVDMLKRVNARMNQTLTQATGEQVAGAPKSVDGIWKKLTVDKIPKLEQVGDAVRGRIDLTRYSGTTVEEQLQAIARDFDRPGSPVEFKYRDLNIDRATESYRGRVNINGIRDPEVGIRYELQYGAKNVSLFYDGEATPGHLEVFVEAKPGEKMPIHDSWYKGAEKIKEIVRGKPAKGSKAAVPGLTMSDEDRAEFERAFEAAEGPYLRSLDMVIQCFRSGEVLDTAKMNEICASTGFFDRIREFFNHPVVKGIVRSEGHRIEGKVLHHLPT